ncbi:hypothetical protein Tco_0802764 [Tanacetum coccineum]|uniref:Reverse transcriptase Ty1/copia-type domain-containing protein n=1 Tax=Tanacetum coccineum TaxID=301880 RepID=A0ABQ5A2J5_9ASTR
MSGFVIIVVYVDDLNIIGTNKKIQEVIILFKKEFEMKDLGKTKYCLGLQIEHMHNGIIIRQSNYTEKLLKLFNMDKAKPLSTPMVGRSLNVDNDPFRPCEDDEEVPVNLLARFSSSLTKRHWNGIKHILRYLRGTVNLGLFYPNNSKEGLVGYVDAGTAISWRYQKQTLDATSSNHAEVIALHEASRECV